MPTDVCPDPPGNELIVTEGFRYVATGPSHRVSLETSSGVVKEKFFSVIDLMSAKGTDIRAFSIVKPVLDDGGLTVRVDIRRAECF